MHIVGTAGHVDHGKSTLVTALTGINPDRLKEEREREMTIDLGFASLTLPNGEKVGIIDVPGHRDFIGNMLAGIGGIDAVLLIIAADEGVAAQTREHLAILDLLHITRGLVVLTKLDLVSDPEWLELVELEARETLRGTSLDSAPIIKVSARTGAGIPALLENLQTLLENTATKPDLGRPRLPIDRVFSLTGFGTVVTGTLLDGSFSVGDEVVSLPEGLNGRIRGLQTHNQKLQKAFPGSRTALNLVGIENSPLIRGSVIARPGTYSPTALLDVHFRYLPDAPFELRHNTQVKIFIGSAERAGNVRLLGKDILKPGEQAFLQIKLDSPVVAARGDRLIVRLPSPAETLGGGIVLEPHPARLHKRFEETVLQNLERLLSGKEADVLLQSLKALRAATGEAAVARAGLDAQAGLALCARLIAEGSIVTLQPEKEPVRSLLMENETWQQIRASLLKTLSDFHAANPLKPGMSRESLRAALKLPPQLFEAVLVKLSAVREVSVRGALISLASHEIRFTADQRAQISSLLQRFAESPYSPPDASEVSALLGPELMEALIAAGDLVQASGLVLFTPSAVQEMTAWVKAHIKARGSLTLAEFRDHFGTSRKYAAALLEFLDEMGVTLRKGDIRVLKQVK